MSLPDSYSKFGPEFVEWLESDLNAPRALILNNLDAGDRWTGADRSKVPHRDNAKTSICKWLDTHNIPFSDTTLPMGIAAMLTPVQMKELLESEALDKSKKGHEILTSIKFLPPHIAHLASGFDGAAKGKE